MKSARIIVLLGLAYLTALLMTAPAQIFAQLLAAQSGGRIQLAQTQGTIWKGHAYLQLPGNATLAALDAGKISWDIQLLPLLAGKISVTLRHNESAPFLLTLSPSRLHLQQLALTLPGTVLPHLMPTLQAAALGGNITVRAENVSVSESEIVGQLDIDWSEVSSSISPINPLGNYHLRLSGSGSSVKVNLQTASGSPLIMEGTGIASIQQGVHFEGSARANDMQSKGSQAQQLEQVLRLIGNESLPGSGSYKVKI
jgi:general secretion pathway protein N